MKPKTILIKRLIAAVALSRTIPLTLPDLTSGDRSIQRVWRGSLRSLLFVLAIALGLALPATSSALVTYDRDSIFYYEIGGSSATPLPQHFGVSKTLIASADARLNYSCGNFDLLENLESLFDEFKNGIDKAILLLEFAAKSIIDALPLYLLYRADPNLANMFVNAMARYEEIIRIAVRDCEQTEQAILAGDNPFKGFIRIAKAKKWGDQQEEGATATEAQEAVNESPGPIIWVDGEERGGAGQEPIRVIGDVCGVGYRLLTEGADAPPDGVDSRIETIWPDEAAACEWATEVLGELEIWTEEEPPKQTPGLGTVRRLEAVIEEIELALMELVGDQVSFTDDQLEERLAEFEAPGVAVTIDLIDAIRDLAPVSMEIAIGRLVTEIAAAQVAEEILTMRRILLTGSREPHVYATPAWGHLRDYVIPELDQEYEYLHQENAFKREFVSQTAVELLEQYYGKQTAVPPRNAPSLNTPQGDIPLRDGAIILPSNP